MLSVLNSRIKKNQIEWFEDKRNELSDCTRIFVRLIDYYAGDKPMNANSHEAFVDASRGNLRGKL